MFYEDYFNFLSLITVLGGKRDIGRLVVSEGQRKELSSYLKFVGMKFESIKRSETKDSFPFEGGENRWFCTDKDLEEYKKKCFYIYISKSRKLIDELKESEICGGAKKTGGLLGYPECCIKKFIYLARENKFSQLHYPVFQKLGCKLDINDYYFSEIWILNRILKTSPKRDYFPFFTNYGSCGKTLILHYPCTYDCKCSIDIGKRNFELVNKISERFGEHVKFYLTRPLFLSKKFSINFECDKPSLGRVYNSNEFYRNFIEKKSVEVLNNNSVKIGNKTFNGRFVFFR
jgi:hypothetical protein